MRRGVIEMLEQAGRGLAAAALMRQAVVDWWRTDDILAGPCTGTVHVCSHGTLGWSAEASLHPAHP